MSKEDDPNEARSKIGFWLRWIKDAKRKAKDHWEDAEAAYDEYEFESSDSPSGEKAAPKGYPIYWAASQTLEPSYYARTPKIIVKRLFGIDDPMALTMSLIAERLTQNLVDNSCFDDGMIGGRGDFIHACKATTQVIYNTEVETVEVPDKLGNLIPQTRAIEATQEIILAPCPYDEVLHTPNAKYPAQIKEMAYAFTISKDDAEKKFNADGKKEISYQKGKLDDDDDSEESSEWVLKGWECYDKRTKMVYTVSEGYKDDFLLKESDPLGLPGFFPSPKFIFSNKHRKSLYPTCTYVYLEGTCNQLHKLYERIYGLIDSVRRRALVHGASPELIAALNNLEGQEYLQAGTIQDILEKGGINNMILWVPVKELVEALAETITLEEHFKQNFNEWFGVPDILRGISEPEETALAVQTKTDAAHDRFKYNKKQMMDLARDSAEMLFDVALKVYSDSKIAQICGYNYLPMGTPGEPPSEQNPQGIPATLGHKERFPEALANLRNSTERLVRIDIETDSTSFRDETKAIAKQTQIAQTLINGLGVIGGMQNREFSGVALSSLLSVLESMGGSSQTEDAVKSAVAELERAKATPQPPPPDYEGKKLEIMAQDSQMRGEIAQVKAQLATQEIQLRSEIEITKAQLKAKDLELKTVTEQNNFIIESKNTEIAGMKVESDSRMKQMQTVLDARNAEVQKNLDTQRLDLEKFATIMQEKDRALQEARLQSDEKVQIAKLISDHNIAKHEANLAQLAQPSEAPPPPKPPVVHVHNNISVPSGNKEVIRGADGLISGIKNKEE